jgi:hypothetical protein
MSRQARKCLFRGEWRTVAEIVGMTGIPKQVIYKRLKSGLPIDREPKRYLFRGEWLTVSEIAAMAGQDASTIHRRIDGDRIRPSKNSPHYITHDGKTLQLVEWSRLLGIPRITLQHRIRRGWPVERALTEPVNGSARP